MAALIKTFAQYLSTINEEYSDPRVKSLFLTGGPWPLLIILFLYQRFVKKWGPDFMNERRPFNLKKFMIVYNIVQIYLSAYLTFESVRLLYWSGHYSIKCQPMVWDDTPLERKVVFNVWLYYMIKVLDLMDTVIFILRKNYRQVTFLHIYHHIGMCMLGYIGTKYVPGGHGVMLGTINCFVHTVMYSYYLIAIVRPEWVRPWWKKYITQLQILQFLILTIHFGHVLFRPSCKYPKWVSFVFLPQNLFMLILFTDFYIKTYLTKKKVRECNNN